MGLRCFFVFFVAFVVVVFFFRIFFLFCFVLFYSFSTTPNRKALDNTQIRFINVIYGLYPEQKDMIPVHYAALNDREDIVELFFNVRPDTMTQINAVSSGKPLVFVYLFVLL